MAETISAENDPPKIAVNFDFTDIEDIDGFSDGIDAEPSSDDDTFISYKKKKPTKRRIKDELHSRIEKEIHQDIAVSSESESKSIKSEESLKDENKIINKNLSPQLCPPTDQFNELERKMNGPGWIITSSSACSEDELGANERDEFTFKMCQIIRRNHRFNKKKNNKNKQKEPDSDMMIESTTTVTEITKSENEAFSDDDEKELKFCCGNVPIVGEDDL